MQLRHGNKLRRTARREGLRDGRRHFQNRGQPCFQPASLPSTIDIPLTCQTLLNVTFDADALNFDPQGQSTRMPLDLEASIERGALHILGRTLPLPISGTGSVQLAYTDGEAVRIFRSGNGSVSVQVKRELLQ